MVNKIHHLQPLSQTPSCCELCGPRDQNSLAALDQQQGTELEVQRSYAFGSCKPIIIAVVGTAIIIIIIIIAVLLSLHIMCAYKMQAYVRIYIDTI